MDIICIDKGNPTVGNLTCPLLDFAHPRRIRTRIGAVQAGDEGMGERCSFLFREAQSGGVKLGGGHETNPATSKGR
jgi:hypothetical protein